MLLLLEYFIRKVLGLVHCWGPDWIGDCPEAVVMRCGHLARGLAGIMPCRAGWGLMLGSGAVVWEIALDILLIYM